MINDNEFMARLREAVLDFLEQKGRVHTQKELKAFYGITRAMLAYFRKTRGNYKNTDELIQDCVGTEILDKYQVPFEKQPRSILLKHMEEFGCLPFVREYKDLYCIFYDTIQFKACKKRLSTFEYLWDLVKDYIKGQPLEKCFARPDTQKREYTAPTYLLQGSVLEIKGQSVFVSKTKIGSVY